MPITITGGKYALQTLTVAGTTTVTVNAAVPFVVADFSTIQRIAVLYTSAGVFKGLAYARVCQSTTVLQLESEFFDPVDGTTKTQVIGDRLLISKNFAECATAGWSVSADVCTVTDTVTFGTAGVETSACVYDENKRFVSTVAFVAPNFRAGISLVGGVWCTGHLQNWASRQTYGGVDYVFTHTADGVPIGPENLAAHYFVFGGQRYATAAGRIIWEPGKEVNTIYRAASIVWMNVETYNGILGPNDGASVWVPGTENRMCFINCQSNGAGTATNINWRPSNGVVIGGGAKSVGTNWLSVFGTANPNLNIGALADQRFIVSDYRQTSFGLGLWDQGHPFTSTNGVLNLTNVWTATSQVVRVSPTNSVTFNWYWRSSYRAMNNGTLIQILKADGSTTETSGTVASNRLELTVLSRIQTGINTANLPITYNNASWTWAAWLYGYLPQSGSFSQGTVSLGTGGNAVDVTFGGDYPQTLDVSISQSNVATVAAYTSFSSLDQLYDYSIYWKALNTTNMKWQGISNRNLVPTGSALVFANNITIDQAAASVYLPNTSTNLLTLKAATLASGSKFDELQASAFTVTAGTTVSTALTGTVTNAGTLSGRVTGNVTNTGTLASGVSITGNVSQATPINLTGVNITGNLTFATNTNTTITLTNCAISGTVSNSGTGTVTVRRSGSTIGTVGANVVSQLVTSLTITGLTAGSSIYVANGSGVQQDYVASSGTTYTLDTTGSTGTWSWKVARYGFTAQTGTHSPASASTSVAVSLVADPFITQTTAATVAAYTTLQNPDRLYDYAAYWETTNTGIALTRTISKQGTNASLGAYNATFNSSGGVWSLAGNLITINTSASFVAGVTMSGGVFTTGSVTVTSAVNVATSLTCDVINAGTLSGRVTGNVTNTGTLASGVNIVGNVSQTTPNSITGVTISGNLTYNTNTPITIAFTNCNIGTLLNNGTGLVTITQTGSSVTTYTDPEINYLDSRLTASGVTSVTIYSSAANRDSNTAPGATFSSVLDFRFGSTVSGVVMSGTVYLRVLVSGITLFSEATLTLGSNVIDLGVQGQLASITSNLQVINTGVQKSSLLIPHTTNI